MRYLATLILLFANSVHGTELVYNFNSPTFSGSGYSSHQLTLYQLESQAKSANKAAADALAAQAAALAATTPSAKFMANLESRIYSQLAQQLTDSLFGENGAPTCTTPGTVCGTIPNLGGNAVSWGLGSGSDQGMIIIDITNLNNPSQTTTMKISSGSFYF